MFLALRELAHARVRYGLIAAVITLLALLVFLLSGLANGLSAANGAALRHMDADYIVFQTNTRRFVHRSILPMADVAAVRALPGVQGAAPLGQLTVTVTHGGSDQKIDATILAIDPTSFIAPNIASGTSLKDAPAGGVVVDSDLKRSGVRLGDTLSIDPTGELLTVVGFTNGQTYNHLPVIFMDIPSWQALKFAAPGSDGGVSDPISVIAVKGGGATADRIGAAVPGVDVATRQQAIESLPGYSAENSTVTMILVFLFVIAALVLAVFFYVMTLQKTNQFGALKALGAGTRYLAGGLIGQVAVLTAVGVVVGSLLANLAARGIPANVPFELSNRLVAIYGAVLLVVALTGSCLSLIRIARVDPLIAIGRAD